MIIIIKTIFNIITGLIKPDYGSVIIKSKVINGYPIYLRTKKFKIGYVPQYGGYFHDLTLLENLCAIGEILVPSKEIRKEKINSHGTRFTTAVNELRRRPLENTS